MLRLWLLAHRRWKPPHRRCPGALPHCTEGCLSRRCSAAKSTMAMGQAPEKGDSYMAPVHPESINLHHTAWFAHRRDGIGQSPLLPGPSVPSLPGGWKKRGPGSTLARWYLTPTGFLLGDSRRSAGGNGRCFLPVPSLGSFFQRVHPEHCRGTVKISSGSVCWSSFPMGRGCLTAEQISPGTMAAAVSVTTLLSPYRREDDFPDMTSHFPLPRSLLLA